MTLIELATLVRDTRNAQCRYFALRAYPEKALALIEAKSLERKLDSAVASILHGHNPPADPDHSSDGHA